MINDVLQRRAELLKQIRSFFDQREFLEVETPIIASEVIPENHIAPITTDSGRGFLQASPELHMKQLLCRQSGAIFQISRAFRSDEIGDLHRQEFTMLEWYRPGDDMWQGIKLLSEFVEKMLGMQKAKCTSYRDAFRASLGIDPHSVSVARLQQLAKEHVCFDSEPTIALEMDRDEWLNILLNGVVEPTLGKAGPEVLYHYPASQAALAEITEDSEGVLVAERFEIYVDGIELANGYHELVNADELESRLVEVNRKRTESKLLELPIPIRLIELMRSPGLPKSAGVALGFDRLAMLSMGAKSIAEVLPFPDS